MSQCQTCEKHYHCPISRDMERMEGFLACLPHGQRDQRMNQILERFMEPRLCALDAGYIAAV